MGPLSTRLAAIGKLDPRRAATLAGCALVVVWCVWWGESLARGRLLNADHTWFRIPAFGIDFTRNVDCPTRIWAAGGDPYADKQLLFCYPPIVTRLFAWANLTTPDVALRIWVCALATFAGIGAFAVAKSRRDLGLGHLSPAVALAAVLFSTPVLFALERGNYDLLVVPAVVAAVALARRETKAADVIAGLLLAVAAWAKLYPGLLGLGILALGRWRIAFWMTAAALAIGLADPAEMLRFLENNKLHIDGVLALSKAFPDAPIHLWQHSLTELWPRLWAGTPLAGIPGNIGAVLMLGPLVAWVSWSVYRCPNRGNLALGFLMWLLAVATFVPPVSNDYSLAPLVLAVLAVASRRDPLAVKIVLAVLLIWWQPIALPISGRVLCFFKLAGLIAVAASLARRAAEQSQQAALSRRDAPAPRAMALRQAA